MYEIALLSFYLRQSVAISPELDLIYMVSLLYSSSQYSDLFATCAKNEIRVWNTDTSKELLRIEVPNMTCNTVAIMRDGRSIVSGKIT